MPQSNELQMTAVLTPDDVFRAGKSVLLEPIVEEVQLVGLG